MTVYLSHVLTRHIPVYGVPRQRLSIKKTERGSRNNFCQTHWFGMENHWGTHVDCPAHFFRRGQCVADYPSDFWFFQHPQVLHLDLALGQILRQQDIPGRVDMSTDLLLLCSGLSRLRGSTAYSRNNPGLHPEIGFWLRKHYPNLRAIGIDWISISSFQQRDLGKKAHQAFLNPKAPGHPILIVEDMNLSGGLKQLKQALIIPLIIEGIDSAPCTAIGVLKRRSASMKEG